MTLAQAIDAALQLHRAGHLPQAESIYRQVLAAVPEQPDALHLLGVVAHQQGRHDEAIALITKAIAINPASADFHNNLGEALRAAGRAEEALAAYRAAIARRGDYADPYSNLGHLLVLLGRREEGMAELRRAVELAPGHVAAWTNLGRAQLESGQLAAAVESFARAAAAAPQSAAATANVGGALLAAGRVDEAEAACRRALELAPEHPDAHYHLGRVAQSRRQWDAAVAHLSRAVELRPDHAAAWNDLGSALQSAGRPADAEAPLRRAVALAPALPEAHSNLGGALVATGRAEEALACFGRAIALRPDFADAHNNLAAALLGLGRLEEAEAAAREAIRLSPHTPQPWGVLGASLLKTNRTDEAVAAHRREMELGRDSPGAHSALLLALHYGSACEPREMFDEHRRWAQAFESPVRPAAPPKFENHRDPDRRLRIGYVSPDFYRHSVAFFVEPLLAAHDKSQVEVFCYSDADTAGPAGADRRDETTRRLRSSADHWLDLRKTSDEQLAERIRADRIDILVDLAGHTANNRLLAVAREPAPVRVTYLGYPHTTGLESMQYRITDALADPPDQTDAWHTEALVRLPRCAWCYRPADEAPPVAPLTARASGRVTFGSFNKHLKITPATMALWSRVLAAVPASRLVIKSLHLRDEPTRRRLSAALAEQGVGPARIDWPAPAARYAEHLAAYGQIDVALDTFPYHGTTTTCDALYMGVPVVTLAGRSHVSRVGVSLLNAVGLGELVADDADAYVRIAAELARDLDRLEAMRGGLRERMRSSPLMDGPGLARAIEAAYRQMWRTWCAGGG